VPLTITGLQGLDRAISSAGGIDLVALTPGLMLAEHPGLFVDITDTFEAKCDGLRAHVSQVGDGEDVFPRVRERNAELAENQEFELAEAFKTVQMRR
jgi:LmbE family N-acetylglucosaminyl deacetylase